MKKIDPKNPKVVHLQKTQKRTKATTEVQKKLILGEDRLEPLMSSKP